MYWLEVGDITITTGIGEAVLLAIVLMLAQRKP